MKDRYTYCCQRYEMIAKTSVIIFTMFSLSLYPLTCSAIVINADGFDVEVLHEQENDGLHIWGKVEGGRNCKELKLKIVMRNNQDTISRVVVSLRDYSGGWPGPSTFKEVGDPIREKNRKIKKKKAENMKWFLEDIHANCLN